MKISNVISVIFCFSVILFSCDSKASTKTKIDSEDPCYKYHKVLNGDFDNGIQEGVMSFRGGATGVVDIQGVDYNDITCNYNVVSCEDGTVEMNCDGAEYPTTIVILSDTKIKVGLLEYTLKSE
jgi:hypothetical protein